MLSLGRSVVLSLNNITDVGPLATLTNLSELDLYENSIVDMTPLGSLATLSVLDLHSNGITSIDAVATLTGITKLNLFDNPFNDITPLLNDPGLGANDFVDISDKRFCNDATITTLMDRGVSLSYENNC